MENEDVKQVITAIISGDTISVLVKGTRSEIDGVYGAITAAVIQGKINNNVSPIRLAAELMAAILASLDDVKDKYFSNGEISKAKSAVVVKEFLLSKIFSIHNEESEEEYYGEEDD